MFGASAWQRFTRVTLPLLRPSIQTALILRTVLAFEMFATVLTLGGRNFPVLVSEAFNWQYSSQDYGVAAAYAMVVMAISLAATLVYLRALRTPRGAACHDAAPRDVPVRRRGAVRLDAGADLSDRAGAVGGRQAGVYVAEAILASRRFAVSALAAFPAHRAACGAAWLYSVEVGRAVHGRSPSCSARPPAMRWHGSASAAPTRSGCWCC